MSPSPTKETQGIDAETTLPRRRVLALGAGVGATLLAGCTGGGSDDDTETGEFRLLISDQPAAIGDFDSLDVSFSEARVFPAGGEETATSTTTANETTTTGNETTTTANETTTAGNETTAIETDGEDEEEEEEDADGDGFTTLDLSGKTVDLTRVVGEDATPVFEGELEAGEYTKVELAVAEVAGVVDGEDVDVKIPSEKLMITNNFEVTTEEPVDFVFDINVVKRGQTNGYILTPVISGSGVAGRDVEATEVSETQTESA
ncbi:MAG: DUF4382 domain-containing protein [Halodesulfurarchaeum sp.]